MSSTMRIVHRLNTQTQWCGARLWAYWPRGCYPILYCFQEYLTPFMPAMAEETQPFRPAQASTSRGRTAFSLSNKSGAVTAENSRPSKIFHVPSNVELSRILLMLQVCTGYLGEILARHRSTISLSLLPESAMLPLPIKHAGIILDKTEEHACPV